ncbi:MAG: hypothetical protein K2O36_00795 [Ruminococcus sp.]|nr:hypothetical protein [Ruminococcus sp.]
MENIKSAVVAVCVISAIKCIIGSVASVSKLKNQIAMIMNLLLAVFIISPFVHGFSEFEMPDISDYSITNYDYSDDIYASFLKSQTAENIESVLSQQLSAVGIYCDKIEVEVNISADYSISINKVTVTSEDFEAAALIVKSSLGTETEVINGTD